MFFLCMLQLLHISATVSIMKQQENYRVMLTFSGPKEQGKLFWRQFRQAAMREGKGISEFTIEALLEKTNRKQRKGKSND